MRKYRKSLTNARQVRKYLSKVINELYFEEIEVDRAGKIFYGCSILLKSLELDELEARVRELEMKMGEKSNGTYRGTYFEVGTDQN
jgi:hypothetical protein